jgi:hypothetical protein
MPTIDEIYNANFEVPSIPNISFPIGLSPTGNASLNVNQFIETYYKDKVLHKEKGYTIYSDDVSKKIIEKSKSHEEFHESIGPIVDLDEIKIYSNSSFLEFEDFDLLLFTSKNAVTLLKQFKEVKLSSNQIAIFLEINDSTNIFGSLMRMKLGTGIRGRKDLPYSEIINHAHSKDISISSKKIKELLKKGLKSKKSFFRWVLSGVAKIVGKVVKFVSGEVGDFFFTTLPNFINKAKISEKRWNPKIDDYNALFIPDIVENFLRGITKDEKNKDRIIKKVVDPFFAKTKSLEKKTKRKLKASKKYIPNRIYKKIKNSVVYIFEKLDSLEELVYDSEYGFFKLILTALETVNAFLCGLYNSIIDTINGIFQVIGLIFLGIKGLADFSENMGYYAALTVEFIENLIGYILDIDFLELFKQMLLFPIKIGKFIFNFAKKASEVTIQEFFYFLGYIVGFTIETILGILFFGGTLSLNKVLVKTFKEPAEFLFKGIKNIAKAGTSIFIKIIDFIQYAIKKLKDPKQLFKNFYHWLDDLILEGRASTIISNGRVLYSDLTVLFTSLKLIHKKLWLKKLSNIGFKFDVKDGIYIFVHKGKQIFKGDSKEAIKKLGNYFKNAKKEGKSLEKYLDEVVNITKFKKFPRIKNKFPRTPLPKDGFILDFIIDSKGLLKNTNGNILTRDLNFVITKSGKLKLGIRHHLLGNAEDVLAAGSMKIKRGKITLIDNLSGHYKPTLEEALRFLDIIKEMNIPLNRANLKIFEIITNSKGYDIEKNLIKTIQIIN